MITLSGLFTYPVKSCGGIELARAEFTPAGLRHDREWMIVTPEWRFMTQREAPRLALITPSVIDDALVLAAPGMEPLKLATDNTNRERVQVAIWRDHCKAYDAGILAAQWLEEFLGSPCRIVCFDSSQPRPTAPEWSAGLDGQAKFSDGFPVLVLSRASLDDLNLRLPVALPMNRFRPNIVLDGCEPYAEDGWRTLRMGAVELRIVKPCARCIIPSTSQETGEREGLEPLQTLKGYRWDANLKGAMFGQNALVVAGAGVIVERGMTCEVD